MVFLQGNRFASERTNLYKSLGSLIKDYRQWRGLSQETLAESIRVSVRELRNWEADRHSIRNENLHDISEITGIPMQVCIALNSDQPIWYSLKRRMFAYSPVELAHFSIDEVFRYQQRSIEGALLSKLNRITTDNHINMILACHRDVYGAKRQLRQDVIKAAIMILPDLNRILFDSWGHYIGHQICLPMGRDVYNQLKEKKYFEDYLRPEMIRDVSALKEGAFFFYSFFATSTSVLHPLIISNIRYFNSIEQKERYLFAVYAITMEGKDMPPHVGMKPVSRNISDHKQMRNGDLPQLYEIELDTMMRPHGPFGWLVKEYAREADEVPCCGPLTVGGSFAVGKQKKNCSKNLEIQEGNSKAAACPNPKCTMHEKTGKGNIIFNGTYPKKEGIQGRRFFCKECGKSFCKSAGTIFHKLRYPEEKVLTAIKLLAKGMSLRGVAKEIDVKRNTVKHWLELAAKQSEKIDAALKKDLVVSQIELDTLWSFVNNNSLPQRANFSKRSARV